MQPQTDGAVSYGPLLTYQTLARMGFTVTGASQLLSASELTLPGDRRRLARLLSARDALLGRLRLTRQGISSRGAEELTRADPVSAYWDRRRTAQLLAGIALPPMAGDTHGVFDYPGDYAQRFDGLDR